MLYPLLVLRQNIFTDPRVPLAVEQKIYEIGAVTDESPALLTTNFALTYFAVASEIENSKIPAFLCRQTDLILAAGLSATCQKALAALPDPRYSTFQASWVLTESLSLVQGIERHLDP
jgi:hypothetical protein